MTFGLAAPSAATGLRRRRIPIQPFDDAASEGLSLGVGARQPAGKFRKGCALME
jgi:hypothetical protein